MNQLDRASLEQLFQVAVSTQAQFLNDRQSDELRGKAVHLLFRAASTRTYYSFDRAAAQLGAHVQHDVGPDQSSESKGEAFADDIAMRGTYANALVCRYPEAETLEQAAQVLRTLGSKAVLINAGNGSDEHPTQALLDLFTIEQRRGGLDGLRIALIGDMLAGRTIHSLLIGLSLFKDVEVTLAEVPGLELPDHCCPKGFEGQIQRRPLKEALAKSRVWYCTRTQTERLEQEHGPDLELTHQLVEPYLTAETLLMHPLPRKGELSPDLDQLPQAVYLKEQVENGAAVRMALLKLILGPE